MKCPFYDKEMTLSYIQCRVGVKWTPKEQLVAALSFLGRGRVSPANGAADHARPVYAYKCGNCKKVIVDYDRNKA